MRKPKASTTDSFTNFVEWTYKVYISTGLAYILLAIVLILVLIVYKVFIAR